MIIEFSDKNKDDPRFEKIRSPQPSAGGASEESVDEPERRASQRLRHKSRSITLWDYERLVLEEFPTIYKVGVFAGVVMSLLLIGWMLSDLKGPRGRVGPEPILAIASDTPTLVSTTPNPGGVLEPGTATPTLTNTPTATSTATASATPTSRPIEINFNADSYSIVRGECTTLRWQVIGAERVRVLGAEVEHTEAEEVCPTASTSYQLIAENQDGQADSSFQVEVLVPTDTEAPTGCTGYDGNGQLICKTSCTDNDPKDPCTLD